MSMASIAYRRKRSSLALGIVIVIGVGLASRKFPSLFPEVLGSYTGDALWALMVFLGFTLIRPAARRTSLALAALGFSYSIELSQLWQAPWINAIRATTPGHLILGTGFQWLDLIAYAIGIAVGLGGDVLLARKTVVETR